MSNYLPRRLPIPAAEPDDLSAPYRAGLRQNRLLVQRCASCGTWQFGPEWLCHHCHAFDPEWTEVEPRGRIFSWERVWHPSHAALRQHGPYLAVLVELPQLAAFAWWVTCSVTPDGRHRGRSSKACSSIISMPIRRIRSCSGAWLDHAAAFRGRLGLPRPATICLTSIVRPAAEGSWRKSPGSALNKHANGP